MFLGVGVAEDLVPPPSLKFDAPNLGISGYREHLGGGSSLALTS